MNRPNLAILVLALTALLSQPVLSQEYLITRKPKNGIEYAEIHSARRTTQGFVAWVVEDLRHPDLLGHLSKLTIQEVDCQGRRARVRAEKRFTGNRAEGRPTKVDKIDHSWQPGRKDTSAGFVVNRLCGAK